MQQTINDEVYIGWAINLVDNTQKVKSVDYLTDFEDISKKMNKPQRLLKGGVIDMDLIKYLPGMLPLA